MKEDTSPNPASQAASAEAPAGPRSHQQLVEDALYGFAVNLREHGALTDDELRGYILGFCMEYPVLHHALAGRRLVEMLSQGYVGFVRRAREYLRATDSGFARKALLEVE
jgi:hypothetical protein